MTMEAINIKATRNTPAIRFDPVAHTFLLVGNSIPENAGEFYGPVISMIKENMPSLPDGTTFTFCLPYFNSSSLKAVYLLLTEIKSGMELGKKFDLVWHVEEEDDFMTEAAETFTEMTDLEFIFKTGLIEA